MADRQPALPPLPLSTQRVCVALDNSGSTAGSILRAEIAAIAQLSSFLPLRAGDAAPDPLTVLPWNDQTQTAIPLPSGEAALARLLSEGGTDPSAIYHNAAYLAALEACGLWFLFTDGEISPDRVESFGGNTVQLRLHGTACVVVVFGFVERSLPSRTNLSVGITTYALAPDSLFLFHDVPTGAVYVLQASGHFEVLLPGGARQPVLDDTLPWDQLRRIDYRDLAAINIPAPKALSQDERVLADGLVIRLKEVYDGTASNEAMTRVSHPSNIRKIVLSEGHSSGPASRRLKTYLTKATSLPAPPKPRDISSAKAQKALEDVIRAMESGESPTVLQPLREELRRAHAADIAASARLMAEWEEAWSASKSLKRADRHLDSLTEAKANSYSGETSFPTYDEAGGEGEYGGAQDGDIDEARSESVTEAGHKRHSTAGKRVSEPSVERIERGDDSDMHLAKRLRSGRNYAAEPFESSYASSRGGSLGSSGIPSLDLDVGRESRSVSVASSLASSRTVSAPAPADATLSKLQDGRPRPHGTTFEGGCDFCRRRDVLTLLVLVLNASPTTTPSDQSATTTPSTSRIASPSLSEIFHAHVCCSRCALLIVPPAASVLPVPIRFGLRLDIGRESAIAGVSMWRAGLEDLFPGRHAGLGTSDGYCESLLALLQASESAEWLRGSRRDDDRSMLEQALHWVTAEMEGVLGVGPDCESGEGRAPALGKLADEASAASGSRSRGKVIVRTDSDAQDVDQEMDDAP